MGKMLRAKGQTKMKKQRKNATQKSQKPMVASGPNKADRYRLLSWPDAEDSTIGREKISKKRSVRQSAIPGSPKKQINCPLPDQKKQSRKTLTK